MKYFMHLELGAHQLVTILANMLILTKMSLNDELQVEGQCTRFMAKVIFCGNYLVLASQFAMRCIHFCDKPKVATDNYVYNSVT